jgi:hypothetical protein
MEECKDCEYKGYSPQVCMVHAKHCRRKPRHQRKPLPAPVKIGAKTLAGAGMGVAAVILGSAAVSLVGGAAVIHALLLKVGAGAGLTGGGIGLYKGLSGKKDKNRNEQ